MLVLESRVPVDLAEVEGEIASGLVLDGISNGQMVMLLVLM